MKGAKESEQGGAIQPGQPFAVLSCLTTGLFVFIRVMTDYRYGPGRFGLKSRKGSFFVGCANCSPQIETVKETIM